MDLLFYLSIFLFVGIFSTLDINIDFDFWARLTVGKSYFQQQAPYAKFGAIPRVLFRSI